MLAPIVPTLMTNFMASRRAGYPVACEDFPPTKQPPECQDAYSDVVFWSSASSFISNGMTFLLVCLFTSRVQPHSVKLRPVRLRHTSLCMTCSELAACDHLRRHRWWGGGATRTAANRSCCWPWYLMRFPRACWCCTSTLGPASCGAAASWRSMACSANSV